MPNCCGVGSCVVLFLETGEGTRNCCGVGSCAGLFLETGVELESSRSRSMILWTSSALEGGGDLDWDCPAGVGSGYAGFTDHSWLQGQRHILCPLAWIPCTAEVPLHLGHVVRYMTDLIQSEAEIPAIIFQSPVVSSVLPKKNPTAHSI